MINNIYITFCANNNSWVCYFSNINWLNNLVVDIHNCLITSSVNYNLCICSSIINIVGVNFRIVNNNCWDLCVNVDCKNNWFLVRFRIAFLIVSLDYCYIFNKNYISCISSFINNSNWNILNWVQNRSKDWFIIFNFY